MSGNLEARAPVILMFFLVSGTVCRCEGIRSIPVPEFFRKGLCRVYLENSDSVVTW